MTGKNHPAAQNIQSRNGFKGYTQLDIVSAEPRRLSGDGFHSPIEREVLQLGEAVSVLLYIPETDEVLLNRQFRMGALMAKAEDPFLYECVDGRIDDGEDPAATARRETREETGSEIIDLVPLGNAYSSPGNVAQKWHLFIGRIAKAAAGIYGEAQEGEEIETRLFPAEDAIRMADEGKILNICTLMMINRFARQRDALRRRFTGTDFGL